MISVFGLAVCIGFYLVAVGKWPVVIIGIASILSAIAYTGGPYPLGYHGLGEVFCFIFFGPVAVCGTAYVETLNFNCVALAASVPIGLLCANILVVNNLRDIETDVKAGKRTVAVRIGKKNTLLQYAAFVGASFVTPIVMVVSRLAPPTVLLTLLSLPIAVRLFLQIAKSSGKALNPLLGRTAQLELIFGALLTIGLYI